MDLNLVSTRRDAQLAGGNISRGLTGREAFLEWILRGRAKKVIFLISLPDARSR